MVHHSDNDSSAKEELDCSEEEELDETHSPNFAVEVKGDHCILAVVLAEQAGCRSYVVI